MRFGGGQTKPAGRLLVAQLATPLRRFQATEAGSAGVLLAAAVIALVWANSPWADAYESLWHTEISLRAGEHALTMDLGHWIDDAVGVLLAAVVAALAGRLVFALAARVRGERSAGLPMRLDGPVDSARDHIRGPADAPLTLVEYGDFECAFCGRATGVVRSLRERFGDELRYVFWHLPLPDVHPHAELAARAAEVAGAHGRFWPLHDLLSAHQDALELADLLRYAADVGLEPDAFARELGAERHAARVRADVASGDAGGAVGTPTFFVGDRRHVGPYDADTLARELEALRLPLAAPPIPGTRRGG
jgi:protein-disulfide isomerase